MMQQKSNERQAEYAELLKKPQWQKRRQFDALSRIFGQGRTTDKGNRE